MRDYRRYSSFLTRAARLMVGLPDYDLYVLHRRIHHPDEPIMSRQEFFRERQENRYGGNGKLNRCC
ncbi:CstA-like transporter-associated (seleno)protein [Emcibacter sp. SYSU 3D8]|uniref:YbdD/YjiX family protein n=1 Tax=Emcibacter sp. SYSU 3D8 TaxID=3133969 RepID=UPI0031FE8BF6